jgi:ferrous iron transport protein A
MSIQTKIYKPNYLLDTLNCLVYLTISLDEARSNRIILREVRKITEVYKLARISMRKMQDNQSGTISAVKIGGELGRRIRDMGLVPGAAIKIQGRAPLYDPVALRVMGFTLTLRNNEADYIEVEVE